MGDLDLMDVVDRWRRREQDIGRNLYGGGIHPGFAFLEGGSYRGGLPQGHGGGSGAYGGGMQCMQGMMGQQGFSGGGLQGGGMRGFGMQSPFAQGGGLGNPMMAQQGFGGRGGGGMASCARHPQFQPG